MNASSLPTLKKWFSDFEYQNLMYLKADVNYTILHFEDGITAIYSYTLKHFEQLLAPNPHFVRIHKSVLVNRNYISEIKPKNVILNSGIELPVARRRKV